MPDGLVPEDGRRGRGEDDVHLAGGRGDARRRTQRLLEGDLERGERAGERERRLERDVAQRAAAHDAPRRLEPERGAARQVRARCDDGARDGNQGDRERERDAAGVGEGVRERGGDGGRELVVLSRLRRGFAHAGRAPGRALQERRRPAAARRLPDRLAERRGPVAGARDEERGAAAADAHRCAALLVSRGRQQAGLRRAPRRDPAVLAHRLARLAAPQHAGDEPDRVLRVLRNVRAPPIQALRL